MSKTFVLAATIVLLGVTACTSSKQSTSQTVIAQPAPVAANVVPAVAVETAPKSAEVVAVKVVESVPPQALEPASSKAAEPVAVKSAEPAMQAAAGEKPAVVAKPVEPSPKADTKPVSEAKPTAPAIKPQTPVAKPVVHEAQPAKVAVITQEQALSLARSGNCFACHKIESGLVGPAWKAVAAKYKDDANAASTIASHIKSGGSFGWRMSIMPARGGSKISDADVESLAKFIASLR